jgi:hypothetical protein
VSSSSRKWRAGASSGCEGARGDYRGVQRSLSLGFSSFFWFRRSWEKLFSSPFVFFKTQFMLCSALKTTSPTATAPPDVTANGAHGCFVSSVILLWPVYFALPIITRVEESFGFKVQKLPSNAPKS